MTVTFCGHRDFRKTSASEKLLSELLEGYARQDDELVCYNGGYENFDGFAADCVKNLQKKHNNICNCLVIPYIYPEFLERINILNEYFYETFYPPLERVPPVCLRTPLMGRRRADFGIRKAKKENY